MLVAAALPGIPEVGAGDDLAQLLADAAGELADGDVLVVAHKVMSKAEGRVVALGDVVAGERALALGAEHGKDARLVEVILGESAAIVRSRPGVLICRTHHGFVCANAGVDASNAPRPGEVVLLPLDPDASARALRARLRELTGVAPAIVVTDSFGRAWRIGQCDVAIGIAGLSAAEDWRGRADAGRPPARRDDRRRRRRGRGGGRPRAPQGQPRAGRARARARAPRDGRRRAGSGGARASARRGPLPVKRRRPGRRRGRSAQPTRSTL